MKSRWPYLLVAFLFPLILVTVNHKVRSCDGGVSNGTAVWIPHLNMCAATVSEGGDAYVLDLDTVCGTGEGDCQYVYRSPLTGEPLVLPAYVNENLTPSSYPALFSPRLQNLMYVDRTEVGLSVHVYDLVKGIDYEIASFGPETTSIFDFDWGNEDQLSFVTLNYDSADSENAAADAHLYLWSDEMWNLILREPFEGGEVSCNPIYCELL